MPSNPINPKGGPIISSVAETQKRLKLGDPQVSSYMSGGTYSGADIKVLIHYNDIKLLSVPLERRLAEMDSLLDKKKAEKKNLENEKAAFQQVTGTGLVPPFQGEIDALEEAIEILGSSRKDLMGDLSQLSVLPATKVLGELQTISYSVFREKTPVRTLGSVYPRSFVRGGRTIAGTMIFTIFYEHVLHELLNLDLSILNTGVGDYDRHVYTTAVPDQLPPLNISLVFNNEYGASSHMAFYGVEFVQEGATFSIQDIYSENTVQYVARDFDPMHINSLRKIDRKGITEEWSKTASDLSNELLRLKGVKLRRNPFI